MLLVVRRVIKLSYSWVKSTVASLLLLLLLHKCCCDVDGDVDDVNDGDDDGKLNCLSAEAVFWHKRERERETETSLDSDNGNGNGNGNGGDNERRNDTTERQKESRSTTGEARAPGLLANLRYATVTGQAAGQEARKPSSEAGNNYNYNYNRGEAARSDQLSSAQLSSALQTHTHTLLYRGVKERKRKEGRNEGGKEAKKEGNEGMRKRGREALHCFAMKEGRLFFSISLSLSAHSYTRSLHTVGSA